MSSAARIPWVRSGGRLVAQCLRTRSNLPLPPGRHSAFWKESCEGGLDFLHIWLARRKHRPQGSLVVRTCACAGASPHCCAARAVAPLLYGKSAGVKLFDLTSSSLLKDVRRILALLGRADAGRCTLKTPWPAGPPRLRQPARLSASSWQQASGGHLRSFSIYWPSAHPATVPGWWVRGLMDVGCDLVVGLSGASGRQF